MFGYIKPVKCELKIREFEHYRATYCGLCHALSKDYGFLARFLVNYDFTFLALVLEDAAPKYEKRRCVAHPFCKRSACTECSSLSKTAAASVILSWWKLCDEVADDKSFFARIAKLFLKPAYKKAVAAMPEFDAVCREKLSELCALERDNSPSLDAVADTFASIVASLSELASNPRVMREFFYHIGRIIYLTDALADIALGGACFGLAAVITFGGAVRRRLAVFTLVCLGLLLLGRYIGANQTLFAVADQIFSAGFTQRF